MTSFQFNYLFQDAVSIASRPFDLEKKKRPYLQISSPSEGSPVLGLGHWCMNLGETEISP